MPDQPIANRLAAWNKENFSETTMHILSKSSDGYIENNYTAARLNAIAEYGFARSRPLFDLADRLAEKGDTITLTAEEVRTLADGFETLAFRVGDGVVYDKPPVPTKPSVLKRILRWWLEPTVPHPLSQP